jgi:hypothetical protein
MDARDDARKHFSDVGLTYADLNREKLGQLQEVIQKHLDVRNEKLPDTKMMINKRFGKSLFQKDGVLLGAQLTMRCHYFRNREAITFSTTGFIGFAGWADDTNVAPIVAAFIEWVDGQV